MPTENSNEIQPASSPTRSFFKSILSFLGYLLIILPIVIPIRLFVAQPFIVNGSSMYPTFETSQYLIVDEISYHVGEPKRGDVAIFRFPQDPKKYFIKRIIGLPGETLEIVGNQVFIGEGENKILLDEPYITLPLESYLTVKLEADEYFVMGDNRQASYDSRAWGPLNEEFLIGRAYLRLFPITNMGIFPGATEYLSETSVEASSE